ncbi:MAG: tripartite tricarboxylate transporter substrate binding protein [Clostridia bacterium]|nr:tripartite tricarboxylate transporter substrate binding protein [Clostridia bacterium]
MKKNFVAILVALLVLALAGGVLAERAYPSRTIEFVVPFGAGGSADIFARSFADLLSAKLGVNINTVNKPGAGGVTGLTYVEDQDADGYTLCLVTPSMAIAEAKGLYDFRGKFQPIALMEQDIYVISVLDSNPYFTDWDGFVAYARENPGYVTTGGSSAGGLDEYEALQLGEHIGAELTYVPYDGYGEYKAAFLGGEVDLYIDKLSSFTQMAQYSEIKPMAVVNPTGIAAAGLEGVPSTVELGIDFTTGSWRGIVVKKGTPDEVVTLLRETAKEIYDSPEFQAVLEKDNANLVDAYRDAEEFQQLIDSETEKYTDIVARYSK